MAKHTLTIAINPVGSPVAGTTQCGESITLIDQDTKPAVYYDGCSVGQVTTGDTISFTSAWSFIIIPDNPDEWDYNVNGVQAPLWKDSNGKTRAAESTSSGGPWVLALSIKKQVPCHGPPYLITYRIEGLQQPPGVFSAPREIFAPILGFIEQVRHGGLIPPNGGKSGINIRGS